METTAVSPRQRAVTRAEWVSARKELLAKEKAFTRDRDALSAQRRSLPMVKVDKDYVFDTPAGRRSLSDLFEGRPQLIVYHFMFDPTWDEGCKSCSFLADTFDGASLHLPARNTTFVAVSRAPLAKLEAFKRRMGWRFAWVSSQNNDFNYDFHVTLDPAKSSTEYNYQDKSAEFAAGDPPEELPGLSVFLRDGGDIYHTYSSYGRGLDLLIATYNYLDLTPLGRDEASLSHGMEWVRHHDRYETAP
jgi:predicted dithiol-disulfide oxidoreductase (DUF899 family)